MLSNIYQEMKKVKLDEHNYVNLVINVRQVEVFLT